MTSTIALEDLRILADHHLWAVIEEDGELAPYAKEALQTHFQHGNTYTVPDLASAELLLDHGYKYDHMTDVIRNDYLKTFVALIEAGLNPEHYSRTGWTLLGLALLYSAEKITQFLIDYCPQIQIFGPCRTGPDAPYHLSLAAESKNERILIAIWTRLNSIPNWQTTLPANDIYELCKVSDTSLAERLLADGVDLATFIHPETRETAWHAAAQSASDIGFLLWLAARTPESLGFPSAAGLTPLMYAARWNRRSEIVSFLLSQGADRDWDNAEGITAVQLARVDVAPVNQHVVKMLMVSKDMENWRKALAEPEWTV